MEIQAATADSLLDIMYLLHKCVKDMNRQGMFHWNQAYPSAQTIDKDIEKNTLYVIRDNCLVKGIIVLNEAQPPEYEKINWKHKSNDKQVLIVHRLAVHPLFQKQGIGKKLIEFAIKHAKDNGYPLIRLDVFEDNLSANKLYRKLGFTGSGKFRFPFQETQFLCYELKL